MQATEQTVCACTYTSYRKCSSLSRNRKIEYTYVLDRMRGQSYWTYLDLTVLCIYWLNVSYFKYMFWPSSVFQSACQELVLLMYSFTLWFATTVAIFNNIHYSWQFRIQFNPEIVQVCNELFSNENMTSWFWYDEYVCEGPVPPS